MVNYRMMAKGVEKCRRNNEMELGTADIGFILAFWKVVCKIIISQSSKKLSCSGQDQDTLIEQSLY